MEYAEPRKFITTFEVYFFLDQIISLFMANGLSTLSKLMTISNVWGKLGNTNMVQAKNYRTELDTKI